jgi:hypothetical protein
MHPADYQSPKSLLVSGASTGLTAPENSYFYKLQFTQNTTFTTLLAATGAHCIGSNYSASTIGFGTGATTITSSNFTGISGAEIQGKWRAFNLNSGGLIAYYS